MAAHENAHGVRDRGRRGVTDRESELSRTHGINDVAGSAVATPSFEAAADYRDARLDLIPLRRRDKVPADKRWQERSYDHAEVLERARRDGLNLGVRLPADLVVVDVDPRNFPAGRDSLAELAAAFGLPLASAPHVLTGNLDHPGHHFYFRKPAGVVLVDSVDGFEGVEFKSLGRQVVAAGSVHPTGGLYRWAPDSPTLHKIPDLPARLVEAARRPDRSHASGAGEITAEQLAASLEHLEPTNYRDHGRWLELMMACHHATDGDGEARQEFIEWSTSDPAYADHEWIVGRRWDSLHAYRDGAVTIATLRRHLKEAGTDIAPPDAADDFDVWDEVDPADERSRWNFLSLDDVEALPSPKWLVPGVLTEGSLAAIYGAPESGKSFLAVDMSMAVASGIDWHGRQVERGGVLYIAAEGAPGLGKRFRAWKMDRCAQGRRFDLHLMRDDLNLAAEKDRGARAFAQAVADELGPLRLVVIDTLNQTAAGADENSAKDMGRYIASMKLLRNATGAAVVVVHHSGKDLGKGMRGSSALLGAMDTTVEVERASDGRSIKVAVKKQKDAERESPMRFNMEKVCDSLVLRPTVMEAAPGDFGAAMDPILELARQEANERGGSIPLKELVAIVCERDGVSDKTARRKIEKAVPEGRSNARASIDGFMVWQEPGDERNPKLGIQVRTEG
ncbi:AAA family ATPase [Xanthomonas graminis]|uniref:AAA family ATPase n=1 Tax=Xanthomonas graminis TaxID=3390026 RepID=UPI00029CA359|nr:AAA family ATPase [Xanthomonas translucens]EKU26058.1 Regulatory protein repA [Xanthomonas translucens pv. graminis ART-Xtg29]SBV46472.1 regulatory protein repA [Xanthomonas translucens pv. graminis ART-Xtg29]